MKKKSRKTLTIILVAIAIIIPITGFTAKGNNTVKYTKVIVYPGDTLWTIAAEHNDSNKDIRKLIYNIRQANDLTSAVIMPGQELLIPLN